MPQIPTVVTPPAVRFRESLGGGWLHPNVFSSLLWHAARDYVIVTPGTRAFLARNYPMNYPSGE